MLICPYCRKAILEDSPSCPSCSLTIEGATKILGPVPLLNRGITDLTDSLSVKERKKVNRQLRRFESTLPGSELNILIKEFDPKYSLSTHLFWLFNTAGLSPEEKSQSNNQDLLLGIDPIHGHVAITVGYGLEPFLNADSMKRALEEARPFLEKGEYLNAINFIIQSLITLMIQAASNAAITMGLEQAPSTHLQKTY